MPLNDTTRCYPRTLRAAFGMSAEDAVAIHVYRKPLAERVVIWLLFRFGWALVLGVAFLLSGCADDVHAYAAAQADLADAIAEARGVKVRHIKQPEQELHHAD